MVVDNVVLAFYKPVPANPNTFTQKQNLPVRHVFGRLNMVNTPFGNERGCQSGFLKY